MVYKIEEKVKKIISKELGVDINNITPNTSFSDLGVDGDDAKDLLELVKVEFDLDFTGFLFEDYFYEEVDIWFLKGLINNFFSSKKNKKNENKELTVEMLVKSCEKGKWIYD